MWIFTRMSKLSIRNQSNKPKQMESEKGQLYKNINTGNRMGAADRKPSSANTKTTDCNPVFTCDMVHPIDTVLKIKKNGKMTLFMP